MFFYLNIIYNKIINIENETNEKLIFIKQSFIILKLKKNINFFFNQFF